MVTETLLYALRTRTLSIIRGLQISMYPRYSSHQPKQPLEHLFPQSRRSLLAHPRPTISRDSAGPMCHLDTQENAA